MNYNHAVTMTQIMAVNGDVPHNVGGWHMSCGYAAGQQRLNGVLGEVVYGDTVNGRVAWVCVVANTDACLPNDHPDYRPTRETVWVSVPRNPDMRFAKQQYHSAISEIRVRS